MKKINTNQLIISFFLISIITMNYVFPMYKLLDTTNKIKNYEKIIEALSEINLKRYYKTESETSIIMINGNMSQIIKNSALNDSLNMYIKLRDDNPKISERIPIKSEVVFIEVLNHKLKNTLKKLERKEEN